MSKVSPARSFLRMSTVPFQVVLSLCPLDALELRRERQIGLLDRLRGQDFDFSGIRHFRTPKGAAEHGSQDCH